MSKDPDTYILRNTEKGVRVVLLNTRGIDDADKGDPNELHTPIVLLPGQESTVDKSEYMGVIDVQVDETGQKVLKVLSGIEQLTSSNEIENLLGEIVLAVWKKAQLHKAEK